MVEMCRIAKDNNIKIILYDLPVLENKITNKTWCKFRQSYFDTLRDVAKDKAVNFVDVKSAFLESGDVENYFVNREIDFVHLNKKGYRLVADITISSRC